MKEEKEAKRNKWGHVLCDHGNQANQCNTFPCHGACICIHNLRKTRCKKCGGGAICECGVERSTCANCGGGAVCKCDPPKLKRECEKCMPNTYYARCARKCIHEALKRKRNQKTSRYDKILGMSIAEYRTWIEARWTNKEWSWANYGKVWVLDHIEALGMKANKEALEPSMDDIVRRLHYSNTRPLDATENARKGVKHSRTKVL